jgi:Trk K+ transport system NAD-binding subunit
VVETATNLETARRRGQIRRLPVVQADLEAGLPDARVDRAISLIATSDDNLLNVEACLRAKRERRSLRTIARIFDDAVAARGRTAFGVDAQISAAEVVAPAFVDAALHEHCLRMIDVDGWPMAALRWPEGNPVGARQMRGWHGRGVRLLAVWRRSEGVAARPDGESPAIERDQTAVLVGPHEAMERVLDQLRKRTAPQPPMRLELAA